MIMRSPTFRARTLLVLPPLLTPTLVERDGAFHDSDSASERRVQQFSDEKIAIVHERRQLRLSIAQLLDNAGAVDDVGMRGWRHLRCVDGRNSGPSPT